MSPTIARPLPAAGFFRQAFLVALFTLGAVPSVADLRIATVDLNRIMNETREAKEQREKLTSLSETLRSKGETRRNEIRTIEERLEANKESSTYQKELAAFQTKRRDFARFLKDSEDELKREVSRINQELTSKYLKEIKSFSEKNGFDLVITKSERQRGPILFGQSEIDITEQFLKR